MGLSRNKVAVPEGAAGSPPFYGVLRGARLWVSVWGMVSRALVAGGSPCWCGRDRKGPPCGGVWCGACCWVPGPPTPPWVGVVAPVRPGSAAGPVWVVAGGRVWWWFENWRVDASDGLAPFVLGVWLVVRIAIFEHGAPLWGCPGCSFVCFVSAPRLLGVGLMCVMI